MLVVQSPLNMHAEQWFEKHEATRKRLAAWGAGDGSVITIDNDFYLNTPLSSDDYKHYIELFALEPLSTARSWRPESATAMLMGALFADAVGRDCMPERYPVPPEQAVLEYVDLFLRAIDCLPSPAAAHVQPK